MAQSPVGSSTPSGPSADPSTPCVTSAPTPIAWGSRTAGWSPSPTARSASAGETPRMAIGSVMSLPPDEFLRHFVPRGFVRIRNFGFLANRQRAKLLPLYFSLLGSSAGRASAEDTASEPRSSVTLPRCPLCSGNHARHRALLLSPTACSLSTTACQVRCMNTQLKPRTQVMQQHASPVCASSRSHLRHPCHHACQMAQRSASDSVSPDSQPTHDSAKSRCQSTRPAKPHPTPIEQRPRKKRLPSSRCIRTAPPRPTPMSVL